MHPLLFTIPYLNIPIYAYGAMIVVGFLLILGIAYWQCVKLGKYQNDVLDFAFWALLGGLIGARLVDIAVEWRSVFIEKPFTEIPSTGVWIPTVLAVWEGGLVFWGSVLGGFAALVIFAWKRKLPTFQFADIIFVAVPLGQVFGRLGCLLAGCCYGRPDFHLDGANVVANASFDLQFPRDSAAFDELLTTASRQTQTYMTSTNHTVPLFPSQLAEALGCALIFLMLIFVARNKRYHGQVLLSYAILYSILRSGLEIFRGDAVRGFVIDGVLSTSQFISVVVVVSSLFTMWWLRSEANPIPLK